MEKLFKSTRGNQTPIDFYTSILQGIASDGGLLVPDFDFEKKNLEDLLPLNYVDLATEIIGTFAPSDAKEALHTACNQAYGEGLFCDEVVPVKKAGNVYVAELYQGPTAAFKDMALSMLPRMMTLSLKKKGEEREVMILAATSGDTGKAALEGFKDVEGTCIKVFYPIDGVSAIQQQQMVTTTGKNVEIIGIRGNFDDAQTGVKKIFNDRDLEKKLNENGFQLSSANSINIGRLLPQVAYYVYAYVKLLAEEQIEDGELVNMVVPTGNFGNILAAYYAKKMGVPIGKLICASNENKVLYDFFRTGTYDKNREFVLTTSPSMDILISSNLERLIYHIAGDNADRNRELMESLNQTGVYTISEEMKAELKDFYGAYASEQETAKEIHDLYEDTGYIIDTHTAVASSVYKKYRKETGDQTKTVVVSTASPYKFTRSVMTAIDEGYANLEDFALVDELEKISGVPVPGAIQEIRTAPVLHKTECDKEDMEKTVLSFLERKI